MNSSLTADGGVNGLAELHRAGCLHHPSTRPRSRGSFPTPSMAGLTNRFPAARCGRRLFLHKTISGSRVLVLLSPDGQFVVAAPKKPLGALPAVGDIGNWRDLLLNGDGTLAATTEGNYTVVAVDRHRAQREPPAHPPIAVSIVQLFDLPRDGLRHRALNASARSTVRRCCAEFVQMPIGGG